MNIGSQKQLSAYRTDSSALTKPPALYWLAFSPFDFSQFSPYSLVTHQTLPQRSDLIR